MTKKNILLLITALIWGLDFVAQSVAMSTIGPLFFCFCRFLLGALTTLIIVCLRKKSSPKSRHLKVGLIAGCCLFAGSALQQAGLIYTSPGKAGFITTLYIIFVPILSMIISKNKNKPDAKIWLCVIIAVVGLFLLTFNGSFILEIGDLYLLAGSLMFALHIIVIDKFGQSIDPYKFNIVQFFTASFLSLIGSFIMKESMGLNVIGESIWAIIFVGMFGTSIAYLTQTLGQTNNNPTVASLIMSLESVFASLGGYFFLHDILSTKELIGCIIIFIAIVIAQLPSKKIKD